MNIFVGNLSFDSTDADVKKLFEGFGSVALAVIVMSKEKKAPKSRGFGFVEMPDEQQALAAIAALHGKEFMGRVINVEQARPKTESKAESKPKEKRHHRVEARAHEYLREDPEQRVSRFTPVFNKQPASNEGRGRASARPGGYKSGRRSQSYMKKQALTGVVKEDKPKRSVYDNPMRWRKKKPWEKSSGEHKPWERTGSEPRPWKKAEGESKPWRKPEGGFKPWRKTEGEPKPWKRTEGEAKPWRKAESESKPWKKTSGGAKPWKKPAGEDKSWSKSGQRNRARSRVKSGGFKQ